MTPTRRGGRSAPTPTRPAPRASRARSGAGTWARPGRLTRNRWYSVEQYLKLNTPGQSNGVFRAWVDGQLAFERTDLHWRDVTRLKIESVWLNVFHGGTARTDRDLTLYMDNLVVARRYIGPGNFPR